MSNYCLTIKVEFFAHDDPDARQKANRYLSSVGVLAFSGASREDKLQEIYDFRPPRGISLQCDGSSTECAPAGECEKDDQLPQESR